MLRRLWSPSGLLKQDIVFRNGLNLIVGRYSKKNSDIGINGIGKSSVVRLLDYMLLSTGQRKKFSSRTYKFMADEGHILILEMTIGGTEIVIKRSFGSFANTVILKIGQFPEADYQEEDARLVLSKYFFPGDELSFVTGSNLRSLIPFYLKDDVTSQVRTDPVKYQSHQGATERTMTMFAMYLLGLPNKALVSLEELRSDYGSKKDLHLTLKRRLEQESGRSVEALRTDIAIQDKRVTDLGDAFKQFNFMADFRDLSDALTKLESEAATQRRTVQQSERQLEKLRRFIDISPEIDREDVIQQYRIVSEAIGSAIKRTLDEVFAFRESLVNQRLRFHGQRLQDLEAMRDTALTRLNELEKARSLLMQAVNATDFTESFKGALERLVKERGAFERDKAMLAELAKFEAGISELELNMQIRRHEAARTIVEIQDVIESIRQRFMQIVQEAITIRPEEREDAFFDISSQSGGAATQLPVKISVSLPKVDALGQSRLMLVAYDLTVFFHQIEKQLRRPRFLVHDGVFHGIARRTVVKALNYIDRKGIEAQSRGESFQYIVTFNEDELSLQDGDQARDGSYSFDIDHTTILRLSDDPDDMLFRRQFS